MRCARFEPCALVRMLTITRVPWVLGRSSGSHAAAAAGPVDDHGRGGGAAGGVKRPKKKAGGTQLCQVRWCNTPRNPPCPEHWPGWRHALGGSSFAVHGKPAAVVRFAAALLSAAVARLRLRCVCPVCGTSAARCLPPSVK